MSTEQEKQLASWELPEMLWERMAPLIPPRKSKVGRPRTVNLRQITAGSFYVLRTGIQWQAVPRERFGPPPRVRSITTLPSGSKRACLPSCGRKR